MDDIRGSTILIVDDEPFNIDILVDAFDDTYEVKAATDGRGALETVAGEIPDLILLDIMMPEMDGFEVCKELKASPETREIPIIFITAVGDIESKTKGFELGAADYITKPFDVREVLSRVRTHLELKEAREWLKNQNEVLEEKVREKTREIRENFFSFVKMFAGFMSLYDPKVGAHITRVAVMSRELAVRMKLDSPDIDLVEAAAFLHNIGLIGVPKETLRLADSSHLLTDIELDLIKKSPVLSQRLLAPLDMLMQSGIIIRSHMEKFDGTGYPDGLRGEEIHIGARILSACKAYDRLTYKKTAINQLGAIEFIQRCSGDDFDPNVVASIIGLTLGDEREAAFREGLKIEKQSRRDKTGQDIGQPFENDYDALSVTLPFSALEEGMFISEDIKNVSGTVLVSSGSRITQVVIEKIIGLREMGQIESDMTKVIKGY